jgi:hypothetical protein
LVIRDGVSDASFAESADGELRIVHRQVVPTPSPAIRFDLSRPDRVAYVRNGGAGDVVFRAQDRVAGESRFSLRRAGKTVITVDGVQYTVRGTSFSFPYLLIIVVAAVPMLFALVARLRQRRRARTMRSTGCGYDLRASPDRCPECGKPLP